MFADDRADPLEASLAFAKPGYGGRPTLPLCWVGTLPAIWCAMGFACNGQSKVWVDARKVVPTS